MLGSGRAPCASIATIAWGSKHLEPALLGLDPAEAFCLPREQYHTRALARICEALLEHRGPRGELCDYTELPGAVRERIAGRLE